MKKYLTLLLVLLQISITAQNKIDRTYIIKQTNTKKLNDLSKKLKSHYKLALKKATLKGVKKKILNRNNEIGYLGGFDSKGNPFYYYNDNSNAAASIRVNTIWYGGVSNLNLDGSGIQIGHWEPGGIALTTHQELVGKINFNEEATPHYHATHTACTMVGTGIDTEARGMASGATIIAYTSNNDKSEIANFAASGGLLSNHSYHSLNPDGYIHLYGLYTHNAKDWDNIFHAAPYLTTCKSAGNDRNNAVNIEDNGYDILHGIALCKNLITVGAINAVSSYFDSQSVTQSSFSSWGPTDDWRIKPDLVAQGVSVYSADIGSNNDYSIRNGTSMSAPAVTGAIALLQQHYHNKNNVYMKSATVKALLLGTTDEAGEHDGPDFQNGWGLLNAERAAHVISNNGTTSKIVELSLSEEDTYTTTITVDGTTPLMLAIAWTDPAIPPVFGEVDDNTPSLVNDLDLKITKDGVIYEPWVMTPNKTSNNFTNAAVKGDNFRDNIERIDINNLPKGEYTVTVTHKNTLLNGYQDFSMVINGLSQFPLSTQEINNTNTSFTVYPNPSKDDVYISGLIKNQNWTLISLQGKVIATGNTRKIDVSMLSKGIYILKVGTHWEKIIKQ